MLLIDTTFLAFGRTGIGSVINQLLDVFEKENIKYRRISFFDFYQKKSKKDWYDYFNKLLLNEIQRLSLDDTFLFPANLGGIIKFKHFQCNTIFIVHDLFELCPNKIFSYLIKKLRFKVILNKVDKIITVSNYSKNNIVKVFPSFSRKVNILYPFYIDSNYDVGTVSTENFIQKEKFLNGKFILANGSGQKRKNVEFLLKYANQVYDDFGLKIVLFGKDFYNNGYESIKQSLKQYNCADKIIQLGVVPDEKLQILYQQAACFVFPSLDEGFGLPPVEALQNNCRIAVSNIPIFREVLLPLERYFDFTYESFSENLKKILQMSDSDFLKEKEAILEKFKYENYKKTLFTILFNK